MSYCWNFAGLSVPTIQPNAWAGSPGQPGPLSLLRAAAPPCSGTPPLRTPPPVLHHLLPPESKTFCLTLPDQPAWMLHKDSDLCLDQELPSLPRLPPAPRCLAGTGLGPHLLPPCFWFGFVAYRIYFFVRDHSSTRAVGTTGASLFPEGCRTRVQGLEAQGTGEGKPAITSLALL